MKAERFLEDIFGANSKIFKGYVRSRVTVLSVLVWFGLISFFQKYILTALIPKFALSKSLSSYSIDFSVFILGSLFLMIQLRLLYNKYRPSAVQYVPIILIWITYFFFRFDLHSVSIQLDPPKILGADHPLGYLDYIVICSSLYLVLLLLRVRDFFYLESSFGLSQSNFFTEDAPIKSLSEDKIGIDRIVEKLYINIISDYYEKSFTVGIVGPWGNGKSSLMNALKDKVHNESPDVLEINFHPYLNHNTNDIISEFFNLLATKLSPYNGKLKEQISDYSDKLLRLYKKGELKELFQNKFFSNEHQAAHLLYEQIDATIRETNRPLIVYVDDLDRLKGDEILTVLKLIRNTANFANTVFVVAMDKDFVVQSLDNEKVPESKRFIDKFFQLEIYLPLIDRSILRDSFVSLINLKDDTIMSPHVKESVKQAVSSKYCMFNNYIFNLRDVKRLYNQFVFEESILRSEVDYVDLMNFILLKSKFPKFIQLLFENRFAFLEEKNGILTLKKNASLTDLSITLTMNSSESSVVKTDGYIISEMFRSREDEKCQNYFDTLNCDEERILLESMVYLFSDNKTTTHLSIRRTSIFYRLATLNYGLQDFLEADFEKFLSVSDFSEVKQGLEALKVENRLEQLLDRLSYYNPENFNKFKVVFITYMILYFEREKLEINLHHILPRLGEIVANAMDTDYHNKLEFRSIYEEYIFNSSFEIHSRIEFLGELWESRDDNKLWGYSMDEIYSKGLNLFKEYMDSIVDGELGVNFFVLYHSLKEIQDNEETLLQGELNTIIKKKLTDVPATISFARQILDNNGVGDIYTLSNVVEEMFESKENYFEHTRTITSTSREFREYLNFLDLMRITKFSYSLKYVFKYFKTKQNDSGRHRNQRRIDYLQAESDKILNIFLHVKDDVMQILSKDSEFYEFLSNAHSKWFHKEGGFFLFISSSPGDKKVFCKSLLTAIQKSLSKELAENKKITFDNVNKVLSFKEEELVAFYSIQPEVDFKWINTI